MGDPGPEPGTRARGTAGVIAWVALALALVGGVTGVTAPGERMTTRLGLALGLLGVALVLAVATLRHGARQAHERGRTAAIAAILVVLAAGSIVALPLVLRAGA